MILLVILISVSCTTNKALAPIEIPKPAPPPERPTLAYIDGADNLSKTLLHNLSLLVSYSEVLETYIGYVIEYYDNQIRIIVR